MRINITCPAFNPSTPLWMAVVLVVGGFSVHAQIELGIKAGVNVDYIKTNGLKFYGSAIPNTVGYHAGLFGRKQFNDRWSFTGEIQYIRKGVRAIYPQLPIRHRINFEYFDIALLPAYRLNEHVSIEAGPSFDFQTRLSHSESEFTPRNLLHFGLNVGVRAMISKRVFLNARYYHALTPFETYSFPAAIPGQSVSTSQHYFRTMQLSVGYVLLKSH